MSDNPFNVQTSSPATNIKPVSASPDSSWHNPALSGASDFLGGIPDDILKGIGSVVTNFVTGAKQGIQAVASSNPTPPLQIPGSKIITAPEVHSVDDYFNNTIPGKAVSLGYHSIADTLVAAVSKGKAAVNSFNTPTTVSQKINSTGEAGLGALNVLFTPITASLATMSALPGIGHVADSLNALFAGLGSGASSVATNALDNATKAGVLSSKTAESLKPIAGDTAALIAQILAGESAHTGIDEISGNLHKIAATVSDHIKSFSIENPFSSPTPEFATAGGDNFNPNSRSFSVRNPFAAEPISSDARGEVGSLSVEKDPDRIAQMLRGMGVRPDVADAFAPKIAEATDPIKISDILQTAKGAQNLLDEGFVSNEVLNSNEDLPTPAPIETPAVQKTIPESVSPEINNETPVTPVPETSTPPINILKETSNTPAAPEIKTSKENNTPVESPTSQSLPNKPEISYTPTGDVEIKSGNKVINNLPANIKNDIRDIAEGGSVEPDRLQATNEYLKRFGLELSNEDGITKSLNPDEKSIRAEELRAQNKTIRDKVIQERGEATPVGENEVPPPRDRNDTTYTPGDFLQSLPKDELGEIATDVRQVAAEHNGKVHILDYLSTPEYVLEKIGLGKQADDLRSSYESYLDTRKAEIAKIETWKKSVADVPGSARTIFQYLDGKEKDVAPLMTDKEIDVARQIRAYLKEWAGRLKIPEEKQISRYITHLFEKGTVQKEFDPEIAKQIAGEVAGSVYDPFLQKRLGAEGYKEDVWASLDAYVKRASRKEAMDPALEGLKNAAYKLDKQSYDYVEKLSHRINMRPTELENLVDNLIKSSKIGYRYGDRPIAYLSNKIRAIFYRGSLGLNLTSAVRNLTQGVNTYAELGEKYTATGYIKLVTHMMSRDMGELYENHVLDENFVQDKKVGVYKNALQKIEPALYGLFETAEKINRGAAYFGAKARALAKGATEEQAIKEAKDLVRKTQFTFGSIDTPVALNDDVVKTLTQLQTFSIKQIEFLANKAKAKDFAGLIRFTIGSYVAANTIGKIFGTNFTQQLLPTVGIGGSPIGSFTSNLFHLSSSNPQVKASAVTGLKNGLWRFIPAGMQLHKTLNGLETYYAGKSTTAAGHTRFTVPHTAPAFLQSALFGPSALPQAQEYYNNLGKPKGGTGNAFAGGSTPRMKSSKSNPFNS